LSGFAALLAEVEKKTAGITDTMPEYTRLVNQQSQAWGDLKKAIGGAAAELWVFLNSDQLKIEKKLQEMRTVMADARWLELKSILENAGLKTSGPRARGVVELGEPTLPGFDEAAAEKAKKRAKELHDFWVELAKGKFEFDKEMREKAAKDAAAQREKFYKMMQAEAEDDNAIEQQILDIWVDDNRKAEEEIRRIKEEN